MTTYFGFIPSDKLNNQINEIIDVIDNNKKADYYTYRNEVTKQIGHELVDNLLTKTVDLIQDPDRKQRLQKVVKTVHSAVETLLKHVLGKESNDKVMDSYHFLKDKSLFTDDEGIRRIGFPLSDTIAQTMINSLALAEKSQPPHAELQDGVDAMINANLEHFLKDFSASLNLGLLKRKAVPIAEMAISKGSELAIHKIMPDMPSDAAQRLCNHYQQLVVKTD